MGRLFLEEATGRVLKCLRCRVDSASFDDIESKRYHGRHGRAYLFRKVINVVVEPGEERFFSSGLYVVNDLHCCSCLELVGWKYEISVEQDQKFKEGMCVLERERMHFVISNDD